MGYITKHSKKERQKFTKHCLGCPVHERAEESNNAWNYEHCRQACWKHDERECYFYRRPRLTSVDKVEERLSVARFRHLYYEEFMNLDVIAKMFGLSYWNIYQFMKHYHLSRRPAIRWWE